MVVFTVTGKELFVALFPALSTAVMAYEVVWATVAVAVCDALR
jgi:hypothetical protein